MKVEIESIYDTYIEDGVEMEYESKKIIHYSECDFYETYIPQAMIDIGVSSKHVTWLLIDMCKNADNTGEVKLPTAIRKGICEKRHMSNPSLSRALAKLIELKCISGSNGVFKIDRKYFCGTNVPDNFSISIEPLINKKEFLHQQCVNP